MAISLFPHNETAYLAAAAMLAETGKAAVVHPTGTGKSFIGFKLCEDNADKRVCWLSPSEYIFRTQLENLAATGAVVPENVTFLTYAKLMLTDEAELAEIRPDYIVLDEFHRCGAEQWGQGVQRLLSAYPEAKLLGLSATNIRYLDNQRDMANELFDGNVASEMTLGEAIVRGILNAPTYVLSVFAYQQDYDRLKSRVRRAKSKATRDAAEKYLEALRRALEQADGLDAIFDKYMADRAGKYLVFCANAEHMREMMDHVDEWFGRIDAKPHVYSAYSDDPATSKAFADFKADGSDHLKLLFCIDMLNEGIHVEDVSGVILFRPTISPIIYKQQIGRALSASKAKEPVIFDIVNNIENLYSISTIEQEMQVAVNYYRFLGEGGMVVNERFRVIDELRDARELFEQLNDTLTASWELMYEYAKQYHDEHGDLDVPRRYKTADGYSLGAWLMTQRKVYAGIQYGVLGEDRIQKLEAIGMRWGSFLDQSWERYYQAAKNYYDEHGNLKVVVTDVTTDGIRLGQWIANLRTYRKSGIRSAYLTQERIQALDRIGMVWDVPDYLWEENYAAAMQYYREHGNLDMPNFYVTEDGLRLGAWIFKLRALRKNGRGTKVGAELTQEQIDRLDDIGMIWDSVHERAWEHGLTEARAYYSEHGNLNVPSTYVSSSGYALGKWICARRSKGRENHSAEGQAQLDALGMIWQKPDSWKVRYVLAKAYYEEHGDLKMPPDYKPEGIWVSKWLNEQRQIYIGNRPGKSLTQEQIQLLEAIGMDWGNRNHNKWSAAWDESYQDAKAYYEAHGDLKVPEGYKGASGKLLAVWILRQRTLRRAGKLPDKQVQMLDKIGMIWECEDTWEIGYLHAEQFYKANGHLAVKGQFVCEDGYRLGSWIANQRANHNHPTKYHYLTDDQAKRLEQLGMVWSPSDRSWQNGYNHAKKYSELLRGKPWQQTYVSPDGFKTGEWIRGQVRVLKRGRINSSRLLALREIGLLPDGEWMDAHRGAAISVGGGHDDLQIESRG